VSPRSELEGARNIKFRQVQAAESVISYVPCVVCIALDIDRGDLGDLVWRGSLPALIYFGGTGLHRNSNRIRAQESYPSGIQIVSLLFRLILLLFE
jgi:hypothetical protein